jgi:hypothetical protein
MLNSDVVPLQEEIQGGRVKTLQGTSNIHRKDQGKMPKSIRVYRHLKEGHSPTYAAATAESDSHGFIKME